MAVAPHLALGISSHVLPYSQPSHQALKYIYSASHAPSAARHRCPPPLLTRPTQMFPLGCLLSQSASFANRSTLDSCCATRCMHNKLPHSPSPQRCSPWLPSVFIGGTISFAGYSTLKNLLHNNLPNSPGLQRCAPWLLLVSTGPEAAAPAGDLFVPHPQRAHSCH